MAQRKNMSHILFIPNQTKHRENQNIEKNLSKVQQIHDEGTYQTTFYFGFIVGEMLRFNKLKTSTQYSKQKKQMVNKYIVYFTTLAATGGMIAMIGGYAAVKKSLQEEFGFEEDFLGVVDAFGFLGRLLGMVYLSLWPSRYPRRDYFLNAVVIVFFLGMVPAIGIFPYFSQPLLLFGFLISGFSRAYIMMPYMIVSQYFNASGDDKNKMNIWYSLMNLGDASTLLLSSYGLKQLQWKWEIVFSLSILLFLFFSTLMYMNTEEIKINRENGSRQPIESINEIKQFLKTKSNLLWMLDFSIISSVYYTLFVWLPFYLEKKGIQDYAITLSVFYPIGIPLGSILFGFLLKFADQKKVTILLLFLSSLMCFGFVFLGHSSQDIPYYIVIILGSGLFQGGPFSNIYASEMKKRVNSPSQHYLVLASGNILVQSLTFIQMIIIGFLIKRNIHYFIYYLLGVIVVDLLLYFYRRTFVDEEPDNTVDQEIIEEEIK